MLRKSLAFVVVALLLAAGASAQSVGLVLSGGGAKGLYHIGVIQALEENEIPIDYVAGTSMGSIIAALYAAGYSPEEMRAIVDSGQVREWVSGRIDSRYASYYRQMQDQPSMLTLRLNLRDEEKRSDAKNKSRLVLPSHLISSSQIDLALAETADAGFDGLRRRFRPAHGAVPVRGQRPGGAQTLCAQNGRPGRSGACFDGHSAGVQPDREGFDAALRRRYLRQFSVETPRRNLPSRLPDRQQMHVGQHRTQRQKHHGPGVDAHHGEDRLRHAGRPQHAYRAGGRRFDARLFSGRRHYPVGL